MEKYKGNIDFSINNINSVRLEVHHLIVLIWLLFHVISGYNQWKCMHWGKLFSSLKFSLIQVNTILAHVTNCTFFCYYSSKDILCINWFSIHAKLWSTFYINRIHAVVRKGKFYMHMNFSWQKCKWAEV